MRNLFRLGNRFLSRSPGFMRFLAAGGIAALVSFVSRIFFNRWTSYTTAIVLAYIVGMATAFILNRLFVFTNATNRTRDQIFWFVAVNVVAVVQTVITSLLLANYILPYLRIEWHRHEIAHFLGMVTPVFTSFLGHKHLSFSSAAAPTSEREES